MADLSTGFKLTNGEWKSMDFFTDDKRYVIKPHVDGYWKDHDYAVFRLGNSHPMFTCKNSGELGSVHLVCGGLGYGYIFSQASMRFQEYYGIGFLDGKDEPGNTPSITIGTCSPV